ncbi:MAG: DUF2520 domain-containing protein [Bacteroidota bacterium]|nr:DUF2520 domain-containing protein [Bacteroidota bacterium]
MDEKLKIILIGTGNVAHHLGPALQNTGHDIIQLIGRNKERTRELAEKLNVDFITDFKNLKKNTDLIILSVSDNAIHDIIKKSEFGNALVVHTSGSVSMEVLNSLPNYGVFYPLQTFSKQRALDFSEIPIFIEANSEKNIILLKKLALQLTPKVEIANSEKRKLLHLAAVFACNFSNHMYAIAEYLLEKNGFKFEYLEALIMETARKSLEYKPQNAQTGPALRNDKNTIDKHLALLSEEADFQKIYSFVSKSILDFSKEANCNNLPEIQE